MQHSLPPFVQSTGKELHMDGVSLAEIAHEFGSPAYVYSHAAMTAQWQAFDRAFGNQRHLICYAVKACPNLAVLNTFAQLGSGFDIVSGGELERVLLAGADASRVVFSGIGKRRDEIERALEANIRCFNVESVSELNAIERCARSLGKTAVISLRVNPDVRADTHAHIATGMKENKFGLPAETAMELYRSAAESDVLETAGVSCHIGSQLTTLAPFSTAARRVLQLVRDLEANGLAVRQINFGGGLGVAYGEEKTPEPADYVACLLEVLRDTGHRNCSREILIEPGRALVASAGLLLTRILYLKTESPRNFAIVDAAMNDLLRPALYGAHHRVTPVTTGTNTTRAADHYDVVGPVCESADTIARNCRLAVSEGDLLAILSAGAYGFSMASNYNSRLRPAEVLVREGSAKLIRKRETLDALTAGECLA